jgi:hypothetical protein
MTQGDQAFDGSADPHFAAPPAHASWRHKGARDGFEVVFISVAPAGYRFEGHTAAVEDGEPWSVQYAVTLDERWHTRRAVITGQSANGASACELVSDGSGHWIVDGVPRPELDGCLDVDLESSACTNTFPVHRLRLATDESEQAPAAYVRASDLRVERLEQTYRRLGAAHTGPRFAYEAPVFDFTCELQYDPTGLVVDYPGIAARVA